MLYENVKDLKAKGSIRFSCGISSPLYTCTKFSMAFGTLDLLTHVTENMSKEQYSLEFIDMQNVWFFFSYMYIL